MTTKILGTGHYVPDNIVTNNDLSMIMETNDEWISSRTGIRARRITKNEGTSKMAIIAAKRALESANVDSKEIDLIIVATGTADMAYPNAACEVQKEIEAVNATCYDLNAACTGFIYGLVTAHAFISANFYRKILIIGSESMSKMMNWDDRNTSILFGDGAGAAVVGASDRGILNFLMSSDGNKKEAITCRNRDLIDPFAKKVIAFDEKKDLSEASNDDVKSNLVEQFYVDMDGQEVFKFAVKKVPESIQELLDKSNMTVDDIDYFVLHQANSRIIASVAKKLRAPMEKFPMNLDKYGNTSAASLPILLDEMNKNNLLKSGQKIVLSGFGAGLTWGSVVLEW